MHEEYTVSRSVVYSAIDALVSHYADIIKFGDNVPEGTLENLSEMINALQSADRIIIE